MSAAQTEVVVGARMRVQLGVGPFDREAKEGGLVGEVSDWHVGEQGCY